MSNRVLSDWLTGYMKYTEWTEPPESYHTWAGISVIAGSLQRRCYLKRHPEIIYPNMYVVLVGPTGRCRKGTAMRLAKEMIKDAGIPLVAESITREQLIRRMRNAVNNFTDASTGAIKFHCSLYCISPELAVFLGEEDIRFMADLTDWYDCADDWRYETKTQGFDHIQGVCFNLFGATAPEWFTTMMPKAAIGGGFTARIIFIVEFEKRRTAPDIVETPELTKLKAALVDDLAKIANLSGEFTFSTEAHAFYKEWYVKTDELTLGGHPPISEPRLSGYCERRATHLRKLCMISSASRGDTREIVLGDIQRGLSILEATEINMPRAFSRIGSSQYVQATEMVLDFVILRKKTKRSDLLRVLYRDVDSPTLDVVERILESMKVVRITRLVGKESEVIYEYIGPN